MTCSAHPPRRFESPSMALGGQPETGHNKRYAHPSTTNTLSSVVVAVVNSRNSIDIFHLLFCQSALLLAVSIFRYDRQIFRVSPPLLSLYVNMLLALISIPHL